MYAVIETGGKQYRVEVGTELAVELLGVEPGQSITLERVLLVADGAETAVGRPLVAGASVAAEVVRLDRADKVIAFKYRPKARRRVKKGHRQDQTILRITDVVLNGKSAAADSRKADAAAKAERERLEAAAAKQAAADAAIAAKLAEGAAESVAPKTKLARAAAAADTPEAATTDTAEAATAPRAKRTTKAAAGKAATEPATPAKRTTKAAAGEAATEPATPAKRTTKTTRAAADAAAEPAGEAAPKRDRTKKDE